MKMGTIELRVPQDRDGHFCTRVFELYRQWEERGSVKLVTWVEENTGEAFSVYRLPGKHRIRMKSTNIPERYNEEIRQRTRVVWNFINDTTCLKLI